jgi:hypothetical protein
MAKAILRTNETDLRNFVISKGNDIIRRHKEKTLHRGDAIRLQHGIYARVMAVKSHKEKIYCTLMCNGMQSEFINQIFS